MCYGDESSPPPPPIAGGAQDHGDLFLESSDGARPGAYFARPDRPSEVGMIVLPDVRGLHDFYKQLAVRFAEAGMHSIAVDYFARTTDHLDRGEDFAFREHVDAMDFDNVTLDVAAAARWLRDNSGARGPLFTVGFCLGGAMSWRQSASPEAFAGCIGFYGIPSRAEAVIDQMHSPLMILAAGQDFTPVEQVEAFAERVRSTGTDVEMTVCADAPHSFFDRAAAEHADAAADAWERILTFVEGRSDFSRSAG